MSTVRISGEFTQRGIPHTRGGEMPSSPYRKIGEEERLGMLRQITSGPPTDRRSSDTRKISTVAGQSLTKARVILAGNAISKGGPKDRFLLKSRSQEVSVAYVKGDDSSLVLTQDGQDPKVIKRWYIDWAIEDIFGEEEFTLYTRTASCLKMQTPRGTHNRRVSWSPGVAYNERSPTENSCHKYKADKSNLAKVLDQIFDYVIVENVNALVKIKIKPFHTLATFKVGEKTFVVFRNRPLYKQVQNGSAVFYYNIVSLDQKESLFLGTETQLKSFIKKWLGSDSKLDIQAHTKCPSEYQEVYSEWSLRLRHQKKVEEKQMAAMETAAFLKVADNYFKKVMEGKAGANIAHQELEKLLFPEIDQQAASKRAPTTEFERRHMATSRSTSSMAAAPLTRVRRLLAHPRNSEETFVKQISEKLVKKIIKAKGDLCINDLMKMDQKLLLVMTDFVLQVQRNEERELDRTTTRSLAKYGAKYLVRALVFANDDEKHEVYKTFFPGELEKLNGPVDSKTLRDLANADQGSLDTVIELFDVYFKGND